MICAREKLSQKCKKFSKMQQFLHANFRILLDQVWPFMPGKSSKMPQNLDQEESEGFSEGMSEGSPVSITDFREYLDKINIRIGQREQRTLFRYFKKEFFKERELS